MVIHKNILDEGTVPHGIAGAKSCGSGAVEDNFIFLKYFKEYDLLGLDYNFLSIDKHL